MSLENKISIYSDSARTSSIIDSNLYTKYEVKRGLRDISGKGVLAGLTEISEVMAYRIEEGDLIPCEGRLFYRGYDIRDLVNGFLKDKRFGYEEICFLLIMGYLPSREQYTEFRQVLSSLISLPDEFLRNTIMNAPGHDMMNQLATSILTLYTYDSNPEDISIPNVLRQCLQLIAQFPSLMVHGFQSYAYYYNKQSLIIHTPEPELSIAQNILHMLRPDSNFTELEAKILDLALVLHAEHGGGNNSTFTTRCVTSSGTDTYAAIAAGIGSLKGPRHGGANMKVHSMIENMKANISDITNEGQVADYLAKIMSKEANDHSGLVYGMGHAVYTLSDPRAVILRRYAEKFSKIHGREDEFRLLNLVETLTPELFAGRGNKKKICANVDLYSGLVYDMLGIPQDLFTPLFMTARMAGWSAHRIEELTTGGRIIRPAYKNVTIPRAYVPMEDRILRTDGIQKEYIPIEER